MIQSQRESCFEAYNNKRKSHKVRDRELPRLSYTSMSNSEKVVLMPINVRDRQSYRETSRFIHKKRDTGIVYFQFLFVDSTRRSLNYTLK